MTELIDHLVGNGEQLVWNLEAEGLGGFEIDDEVELSRLLDSDVGRLRPAQNLVDIIGRTPELRNQTSHFDLLPRAVQPSKDSDRVRLYARGPN